MLAGATRAARPLALVRGGNGAAGFGQLVPGRSRAGLAPAARDRQRSTPQLDSAGCGAARHGPVGAANPVRTRWHRRAARGHSPAQRCGAAGADRLAGATGTTAWTARASASRAGRDRSGAPTRAAHGPDRPRAGRRAGGAGDAPRDGTTGGRRARRRPTAGLAAGGYRRAAARGAMRRYAVAAPPV